MATRVFMSGLQRPQAEACATIVTTSGFESLSQDFLSQGREDEFDSEVRRAVYFVDYRIYFDHFHREHLAGVADHLHGEVGFAVGGAAANRGTDARGVCGINEVHVE